MLSSSNNLGCGAVEPLGSATGCLLSNPTGDRYIAVRIVPGPSTSVWISTAPCKDFYPGSVLQDRKWENLPDTFQEVKLEKCDGKNLLSKLEFLKASMSCAGSNFNASNFI